MHKLDVTSRTGQTWYAGWHLEMAYIYVDHNVTSR